MSTKIGDFDIIFGDPRQPKALPLDHPKARFTEWGTETFVLKKGTIRRWGALPLPCDILFERDVPVHLRDGTLIYVDVFRPTGEAAKVPSLMAWSPYGKQPGKGNQVLDDFPFRMGVPLSKLSELQKWEGPDPAYWVNHGYAIINPDPRGVYNSEGNIYAFGTQEGRDGADVIDWIGSQIWSNGKVGMSGNSYLAISQWFIAAEQPKHLAAIAPWEGSSDLFREASPGGVLSKPGMDFSLQLFSVNVGKGTWENPMAAILSNQTANDYIEDKAAKMEKIQVPSYVVASWSNPIHSYGTFRAFARLQTPKWLRVHDSWEWPDYYTEANRTDLHHFYDYYLKGIDNGWPNTPQFRGKIIDTASPLPLTGSNIVASSFPPPETKPLKLFFHPATGALEPTYPMKSSARFTGSGRDLVFEYAFTGAAIVCGPVDIRLAVSLHGGTDANIFATIEKVLSSGATGKQLKIPYPSALQSRLIRLITSSGLAPETSLLKYSGPWGKINVARRLMIEKAEAPGMPICRMDIVTPLEEGHIEIVKIPMVPMGMRFMGGEKLRVVVSGKNKEVYPPVDQATLRVVDMPDPNVGGVEVEIHAGLESKLASEITLQIIKDW